MVPEKGKNMNYSYRIGQAVARAEHDHGDTITPAALGNISMRPDLVRAYLRHIKVPHDAMPERPADWKPGAKESGQFWLGYYSKGNQD